MQHLVILVTAMTLLLQVQSANVERRIKMLQDINIEPNVIPSRHATRDRRFVAITRRPKPVNSHEPGTTLELTCEVVGKPAPTVHWYKNDAPVYEHDTESNELADGSNPASFARVISTLLVARTEGQDEYTCLASAGFKTARASATVYSTDGSTDLSERAKLTPLAPRIVNAYREYMDTIGSSVVLKCRALGHPRPHVVWKDNKGQIVRKDPRMKVLRSGELVVSSLRWSDMGEFSCEATNMFGSQAMSTFVYPAKAG